VKSEQQQLESFAAVVSALCSVASLGRALRRSNLGTDYIGAAIEGQATAALGEVSEWALAIPSRSTGKILARIWASLGYGGRAALGRQYLGKLVESARRTLES